MKRIISPNISGPNETPALQDEIAAWEKSSGLIIPKSYKNFICKYDGGTIYPNVFELNVDPEKYGLNDQFVFFDRAYPWSYALSLWNREVYFDGTPQGYFFIGEDPGGIQVLLSLHEHDYGRVKCWFHSSWTWGEDDNNESHLIEQAVSFEQFVESFMDTTDKMGLDHWETPKRKRNAVEVSLSE